MAQHFVGLMSKYGATCFSSLGFKVDRVSQIVIRKYWIIKPELADKEKGAWNTTQKIVRVLKSDQVMHRDDRSDQDRKMELLEQEFLSERSAELNELRRDLQQCFSLGHAQPPTPILCNNEFARHWARYAPTLSSRKFFNGIFLRLKGIPTSILIIIS
jgi:hypothetical protein